MNANKVFLIGRITKDLEKRVLPGSGAAVVSFSLATNRFYNVSGEKKEEVEYHNLVAFGKTAEILEQYAIKGQQLFISGRLRTSSWESKETGKKNYRTEIIVEEFQFGSKPGSADFSKSKKEEINYPDEEDVNLEDIPF